MAEMIRSRSSCHHHSRSIMALLVNTISHYVASPCFLPCGVFLQCYCSRLPHLRGLRGIFQAGFYFLFHFYFSFLFYIFAWPNLLDLIKNSPVKGGPGHSTCRRHRTEQQMVPA
ncbi:hypothetical protein BO94DRAFT_133673 [Aspergillus sclerotioniger CBS 115572]|uniref:Uncharacterized protein n=1 Tax=Aspergillus sclerotioniger CBS 115572 TaxID=1450535 RepID=A0A317XFW5_9EURO|nr:hypothetical protein BO94DRAFT_133673 [Aspergillus sclerotioniger CBS 115572]PWY95690.1 hypothetical protein BO94DRAFT_133673 [Aspergillus sclerotioniger CBS 115572]